jgi:hypothetical protein
MSIWGRHDSEPSAEEAHESQAEAQGTPEPAAEHQGEEPTPAFWRAQGETPASLERDPADAPPPAYEEGPADPPPAGVPPTMGPTPVYGQQASGLTGSQQPAENAGPAAAAAVPEPTVAVAREPVVDGTEESASSGIMAHDPLASSDSAVPAPPGAITAQRWSEIMAGFVDDPRGSVKVAADAVDSAVEELLASVRARQQALASSWQSDEADTEQLRTALREYRSFAAQVQRMSPGGTAKA